MEYQHTGLTSSIIAAAFEVHNDIGCGFQEVIYQRALEIEFKFRNIAFSREKEMPVYYKNIEIGMRRVDFLVDNLISVELKAVTKLEDVHLAQAMNYLEAYNLEVGLLINFGTQSLEIKRLYNKKHKPQINGR
jgi:GxxExxY protein